MLRQEDRSDMRSEHDHAKVMIMTHIFNESTAMPPFSDRLSALRATFPELGIGGFLVPRSDEHLGEYVPAGAERLAWLTGFTGSAGLAIVLAERAAVFVDGRYVLQVRQEVDGTLWDYRHITDEPPADWLKEAAPTGARIGYDPLLIAEETLDRLTRAVPTTRAGAPYDLVFANILARPLCSMAYPLAQHLAPGGRAILAGLLATQERMVLAAHRRQGLVLERRFPEGQWSALLLRKA